MRVENTIILDKDTEFKGEMITGQLILEGKVDGVVRAKEKVVLKKGSVLEGEVFSGCFNMAEGSNFRGELTAGNGEGVFKATNKTTSIKPEHDNGNPEKSQSESETESETESVNVTRLQAEQV